MILTNCAACAAPLAHDAPRCVRCKLRCETSLLVVQNNLGNCYAELDRLDEARDIRRHVWTRFKAIDGAESRSTITAAFNYGGMIDNADSIPFFRELLPVARRVLGPDDLTTLEVAVKYGMILVSEGLDNESVEDLTEGKKVLEDIYPRARRIMGAEHPFTMRIQVTLKMMRDHDI